VTDQQVRDYFAAIVSDGPPDRLDLDRAIARGRRRQLASRLSTLGALSIVLGAVGALLAVSLNGSTGSPQAASGTPASTVRLPVPASADKATDALEPPRHASSPPILVTPGQRVPILDGAYLTLSRDEKCIRVEEPADDATTNCTSLVNVNQAAGSVSIQGFQLATGQTILSGVYRGTDAATVTVAVKDRVKAASVIMLAEQPTAQVYLVTWPRPVGAGTSRSGGGVHVEVSDSDGRRLATSP